MSRIPHITYVEAPDSKPIDRRFRNTEYAEAYILGLEDAKRALGAQRLFPHLSAWETLNSLWMETKANHKLTIMDPPDLEYSRTKHR